MIQIQLYSSCLLATTMEYILSQQRRGSTDHSGNPGASRERKSIPHIHLSLYQQNQRPQAAEGEGGREGERERAEPNSISQGFTL
jgi:hypothetical protein